MRANEPCTGGPIAVGPSGREGAAEPMSQVIAGLTAEEVVRRLGLEPHPEGGFYRETFRDPRTDAEGRAASTAIYYLLGTGDVSEWHRVDAAEDRKSTRLNSSHANI